MRRIMELFVAVSIVAAIAAMIVGVVAVAAQSIAKLIGFAC